MNRETLNEENKVVVPEGELLARPMYEERVNRIRDLSGVPEPHFDKLFLGALRKFFLMTVHCKDSALTTHLDGVIAAMKCRRSVMLPVGGDAECINAQKDVWTYAVFAAAMLYRADRLISYRVLVKDSSSSPPRKWYPVDEPIQPGAQVLASEQMPVSLPVNMLFLSRILGSFGVMWLYRDTNVLNAVVDAISYRKPITEFSTLISNAHSRYSETSPNDRKEDRPAVEVVETVDSAVAAVDTTLSREETLEPTAEQYVDNYAAEQPLSFSAWLREQISQGTPPNTINESVNGYSLADPGVFMDYVKIAGGDWKRVKDAFIGEVGKLKRLPKMRFKKMGTKSALILPFDHAFFDS